MKVLSLLKTLEPVERKLLRDVRVISDREYAKNLLPYLFHIIDEDQEFDRTKAYQAAFGEAYDKDKDYELRRQLGFVTKAVQDLLIQLQLDKNIKAKKAWGDILLAESLFERKAFDLLGPELKRIRKQHENMFPLHSRFDTIGTLNTLEYSWQFYKDGSEQNLHDTLKFLEDWEDYEKLSVARRVNHILGQQMMIKRELFDWEHLFEQAEAIEVDLPPENIDLKPYNNDLYVHMAQLFQLADQQSLEERLESLQQIVSIDDEDTLLQRGCHLQLKAAYNKLASCCYMKEDWDMAQQYLEACVRIALKIPTGAPQVALLNMITHYFLNGAYQKAIDLYQKYQKLLNKLPRAVPTLRTDIAASYLMLGQPEEAKKLVYLNSRITDFKKHADRQILAMCFYDEGQPEVMEREIHNALQLLRTGEHHNAEFFILTNNWLLQFARAAQTPEKEQQKKLKKLQKEVFAHNFGELDHIFQRYVSIKWLKQNLGA